MAGTWGYMEASRELVEQISDQGFTDIVMVPSPPPQPPGRQASSPLGLAFSDCEPA